MTFLPVDKPVIAVIGLGYVGLPLVIEFGKITRTIGIDINPDIVLSCQQGHDPAQEVDDESMQSAHRAEYTESLSALNEADFIIVAVPTPVSDAKIPDFGPLIAASTGAAQHMKRGATIIFESTVYPGATEEICIPVLENQSGLIWKQDFFVGYSPERINPGDKEHTLTTVLKVVSGDTHETLERIAALYEMIVKAGVFRCNTIKVAEAAKVIENTQRDLNIALMNELAIIFNRLNIDTSEVLDAAGTKWNFLKFKPGLVGGHCIGVDPYYLTHKAQSIGYHPEVILAGRRINDGMGKYIAEQTIKQMIAAGNPIKGASVNLLGLTFKENCADLRNTRVIDIIRELNAYGVKVHIHDPWADSSEVMKRLGTPLLTWPELPKADALILAVAHQDFHTLTPQALGSKLSSTGCIIDVKALLNRTAIEAEGFSYWRL